MLARLRFRAFPGRRLDFTARITSIIHRGYGAAADLRLEEGQPAHGVGHQSGASRRGHGGAGWGVAKAYADLITISGYARRHRREPVVSISTTRSQWELGMAEHRIKPCAPIELRHRVRLRPTGWPPRPVSSVTRRRSRGRELRRPDTTERMSGWAASTLRICHLTTDATGVATQPMCCAASIHRAAEMGSTMQIRGAECRDSWRPGR